MQMNASAREKPRPIPLNPQNATAIGSIPIIFIRMMLSLRCRYYNFMH
jgi:hypothetical protein